MRVSRRQFLRWFSAAMPLVGAACATRKPSLGSRTAGRVVVIGAGFGGATAAKYLRMWSPDVEVALVERNSEFVSCPMSNRVLAGVIELRDLALDYGWLVVKYGVRMVRDATVAIDPVGQQVRLAAGGTLKYDRLIISPGVDFLYDDIPGLRGNPAAQDRVPHAWKAGPQTVALRKSLEAMRDGGIYAITVPKAPYRCPAAPYERACQVAFYFKARKPRSKILILDANDEVQSEKALFAATWAERYGAMVEYRPGDALLGIDPSSMTAKMEFENVKADVLNVVPPQRAARIALDSGLADVTGRWCEVDFLTYESKAVRNVHVLGDAIQGAPLMPKSGHIANQQAKVCAAAVASLLHGDRPDPRPMLSNACYSFVTDKEAFHSASVFAYNPRTRTMEVVPGTDGGSAAPSELEGRYAQSWGLNIWDDMLA